MTQAKSSSNESCDLRPRARRLIACLLASATLSRAEDSPDSFRDSGVAALKSNRPSVAIFYFDKLLHLKPDDQEAALLRARAIVRAGLGDQISEAAAPLTQALRADPADAETWKDLEAAHKLRPDEVAFPPNRFERLPATLKLSAMPFASLIGYGGDTPRTDGSSLEFDGLIGIAHRGYVDFAALHTRINQMSPYRDYDQDEFKIGAGLFVLPDVLLRARYGHIELGTSQTNSDWFAVGADWLASKHLTLGLEGFAGRYPDAKTLAVTPYANLHFGKFDFLSSVAIQNTNPDAGRDGTRPFAEERITWTAAERTTLALGFGAGNRAYAAEGFGDVLFNLADRERSEIFVQLQRRAGPFIATFKSAYYEFENAGGGNYHSVANTLSLGLDFENKLQPPAERRDETWFFSAGAQRQSISAKVRTSAPDPLVTSVSKPVAYGHTKLYDGEPGQTAYYDGIVYFDPVTTPSSTGSGEAFFSTANRSQVSSGGNYGQVTMTSRIYSYRYDSSFPGAAYSKDTDEISPCFALRRVIVDSDVAGRFSIGARYGFSETEQDSGRQAAARQTVYQDLKTLRFTYPVSLGSYVVWDPAKFSQAFPLAPVPPSPTESSSVATTVYDDYTAFTRTRMDASLHTFSLGLEWAARFSRFAEVAASAGPTVVLADWRMQRSTEWDSSSRGVILVPADDTGNGLDASWGFYAEATARVYPRGDDVLFLEFAARHARLSALRLRTDFADTELKPGDWSVSAAVGIAL